MKSMNCGKCPEFYGSVTVGERGQIVIPAEARAELEISPGDKLLVMKHPVYKGLMIFQFEDVRNFLDHMAKGIEKVQEMEDAKA